MRVKPVIEVKTDRKTHSMSPKAKMGVETHPNGWEVSDEEKDRKMSIMDRKSNIMQRIPTDSPLTKSPNALKMS